MFDIMTSIIDPVSKEMDSDRHIEYMRAICKEFEASPEFAETSSGNSEVLYVYAYLDFAGSYIGESAGTMKPGDNHEILFELMPRKFSVEASAAENIIAEIRAFWKFIERTRNHAPALRMLEFLNDDVASELRDQLADESKYGMAKSFSMMGTKQGFDMRTQAGAQQFMAVYNAQMAARQKANNNSQKQDLHSSFDNADYDDQDEDHYVTDPSTIRNESARVGRNDPCTCGSGKKFKKCCGTNS